jgi:hypothetical protein
LNSFVKGAVIGAGWCCNRGATRSKEKRRKGRSYIGGLAGAGIGAGTGPLLMAIK